MLLSADTNNANKYFQHHHLQLKLYCGGPLWMNWGVLQPEEKWFPAVWWCGSSLQQLSLFHGVVLSKEAAEVTKKMKVPCINFKTCTEFASAHLGILRWNTCRCTAPWRRHHFRQKFRFLMSHSLFLIKQQHTLITAYKYRNKVQREHSRLYNLASKSVLGISTPEQFICM